MTLLEFQCQHRFAHGFQLDVGFESNHHFTALFGPSGSGKTTILNAIAGFFRPARGVVRLSAALLETPSGVWVPPERRKIGFVFQDALLFPHLTVEGTCVWAATLRKRPPRRLTAERSKCWNSVHFSAATPIIAPAARNSAWPSDGPLRGQELLLMDEPLASLDDPLKGRVLGYLDGPWRSGRCRCSYVTHSQAEVRRAAGWVIVVQDGRLVGAGSPDERIGAACPAGVDQLDRALSICLRIDRLSAAENHCLAHIGERTVILPPNLSPSGSRGIHTVSPRRRDAFVAKDVSGLSGAQPLARPYLPHSVPGKCRLRGRRYRADSVGRNHAPALAELQLAVGCNVTCLLKAHSVTLA